VRTTKGFQAVNYGAREGWPEEQEPEAAPEPEVDPSEQPTEENDPILLPPKREDTGWWDSDWAWTLVALLVWAFICGAVKMPSAIALAGGVAIVFSWRKRRPWNRRSERPPWRGWPGL
jgi:hypothetical protein